MAASSSAEPVTIALVGNPNTGKSTLFTALAGVRQRVGNYPGVTVEKKVGQFELGGQRCELVDLPGTYSLAPRSPDEMVAVDVLLARQSRRAAGRRGAVDRRRQQPGAQSVPGQPGARAGTADGRGAEHDRRGPAARASRSMWTACAGNWACPWSRSRPIAGSASTELKRALSAAVGRPARRVPASPLPPVFQAEVGQLERDADGPRRRSAAPLSGRAVAARLDRLSGRAAVGRIARRAGRCIAPSCLGPCAAGRGRLPVPAVEAMSRYAWAGRVLEGVVSRPRSG